MVSNTMEYRPQFRRQKLVTASHGVSMRAPSALSCLLVGALLLAAPSGQAASVADFGALYDLVPVRADGFVAVDHMRLVKHKAASKLRQFVHDQGGAPGLRAVVKLGLVPGTDVHRSVSFNVGRVEADLIAGPFDAEALYTRARSRLGAAFEEGEQAGHRWFAVAARGHEFVR